jgi:hypothetical protein
MERQVLTAEQVERSRRSIEPKYCRYCKQERMVANFSSEQARKCNQCKWVHKIERRFKPESIADKMYMNAVSRCRHALSYIRKGICVLMSREEFRLWAVPRIREFLRTQPGRPSLERTDDDGAYDLWNLEIVSTLKNSGKHSTNKSNPEMAAEVRWLLASGLPGQQVKEFYDCSDATISRIKNDKLACCRPEM